MKSGDMLNSAQKAHDKAKVYTPQHFSCALGTHLALQETFGIRNENSFKAASGLHGGMGKGDVCGALMGGSLMIGLMCGKSIDESGQPKELHGAPGDSLQMDTSTRLVGELYDWFNQEFGSVKCNDIRSRHEKQIDQESGTGNLTTEEKMQRVHARCDDLCGKAAARTVEILWDYIKH